MCIVRFCDIDRGQDRDDGDGVGAQDRGGGRVSGSQRGPRRDDFLVRIVVVSCLFKKNCSLVLVLRRGGV